MGDYRKIVSPSLFDTYPQYKDEDGKHYRLDHFEMTDNGVLPVYVETDDVSESEAWNILFGEG